MQEVVGSIPIASTPETPWDARENPTASGGRLVRPQFFVQTPCVDMPPDVAFSDQLEEWLRRDEPKTLGALGNVFAEKSFAVTILFLMFVPALPLPTGGITHVFEAITVVLAAQMVLGRRTIWLPERWQQRELGRLTTGKAVPFMIRRIRWFEKFSRPRGARLFRQRWFLRLLGLVLIGFAVAAALAPPFSGLDTLPGARRGRASRCRSSWKTSSCSASAWPSARPASRSSSPSAPRSCTSCATCSEGDLRPAARRRRIHGAPPRPRRRRRVRRCR